MESQHRFEEGIPGATYGLVAGAACCNVVAAGLVDRDTSTEN